ncbi:tyrosine-type recombinase/integrase [Halomonas stenophila]|uniref:Integrase n=1 Tax=Halomonas stenophila TaxID=795312 RepID=A0A7W5HL12_9GAMM|nr:site-specific integrase [Halomonas stenophila]MBB3231071.1 integrase [Halomonas stenophila]
MTDKPITTMAEVSAFTLPAGRKKARRSVRSKHGAGLALEVRADRESKLWVYRFSLGGRQREMRLGTFQPMRLSEARDAHGEAAKLVEKGIDPRRHRAAEKARNEAAWVMSDAFERWIAFYERTPGRGKRLPTAKTVAQHKRRWRLHLAPRLSRMYVRDVTRRLVIEVLEDVVAKAPVEGRHCLNLMRGLLDYAEDRDHIDENPIANLTPAKIGASAGEPRKRHLSMPELRELLQTLDDERSGHDGLASTATLSIPVANAIRLLILTGCRRGEVAGMRWDEIDGATWTIPGERAKSGRKHDVHLAPLALTILKEQRQLSAGDCVFASVRDDSKPIHHDSLSTAISRLQGRARREHDTTAPLYGLPPFTVHDLRRTFATQLTELLLVDPLLVEMMLAHAPPKLMANYNRAKRWKAQVDAWNRWAQMVSGVQAVEHRDNVVVLRG